MKKAFTILELIFVIVIIGILSAIALPRLSSTVELAHITKAKSTVAAVRNAMSTERNKRILRGNYTPITRLSVAEGYGREQIFDGFDGNASNPVLQYPLKPCATSGGTSKGCWQEYSSVTNKLIYWFPEGDYVFFDLANSKFTCVRSSTTKKILCDKLTK